MKKLNFTNGKYTLTHALESVSTLVPEILRQGSALGASWVGDTRMPGRTRLLIMLRLARLMGCPLCVRLFPSLAKVAGLSREEVDEALDGPKGALSPKEATILEYAGAVLRAGGELPADPPAGLTSRQVEQIQATVRLEMLVHSWGLMLLPHAWIHDVRERAVKA